MDYSLFMPRRLRAGQEELQGLGWLAGGDEMPEMLEAQGVGLSYLLEIYALP